MEIKKHLCERETLIGYLLLIFRLGPGTKLQWRYLLALDWNRTCEPSQSAGLHSNHEPTQPGLATSFQYFYIYCHEGYWSVGFFSWITFGFAVRTQASKWFRESTYCNFMKRLCRRHFFFNCLVKPIINTIWSCSCFFFVCFLNYVFLFFLLSFFFFFYPIFNFLTRSIWDFSFFMSEFGSFLFLQNLSFHINC